MYPIEDAFVIMNIFWRALFTIVLLCAWGDHMHVSNSQAKTINIIMAVTYLHLHRALASPLWNSHSSQEQARWQSNLVAEKGVSDDSVV